MKLKSRGSELMCGLFSRTMVQFPWVLNISFFTCWIQKSHSHFYIFGIFLFLSVSTLLNDVAKNGLQGLVIADSKLQGPGTWRHLQGSRPINRRLQSFGPINRLKNATRPSTASGPIHDFCNILNHKFLFIYILSFFFSLFYKCRLNLFAFYNTSYYYCC